MQLSSQSVGYLSLDIQFPFLAFTEEVLFLCTHNTHHVFLHNAKYFFKSLYHNSGTVTARNCRILRKCNKVADKNLTQLKTFDKCI